MGWGSSCRARAARVATRALRSRCLRNSLIPDHAPPIGNGNPLPRLTPLIWIRKGFVFLVRLIVVHPSCKTVTLTLSSVKRPTVLDMWIRTVLVSEVRAVVQEVSPPTPGHTRGHERADQSLECSQRPSTYSTHRCTAHQVVSSAARGYLLPPSSSPSLHHTRHTRLRRIGCSDRSES